MNSTFFQENRKRFSNRMRNNSIAVFFSNTFWRDTADQFYPFSVDRNFYYFTGIGRENMVLMLSKINDEVEECLFIPPVDEMYEKWHAVFVRREEAVKRSGIANVLETAAFDQSLAKKIYSSGNVEYVYVFSNIAEMNEADNLYTSFARKVRDRFPAVGLLNSLPIMAELRNIKDKEEILEIKKAVDMTKEALEFTMKALRPGIYEYEITAHFQYQLALRNSRARFRTIVASGQNAMILHYNAGHTRTKDNDLVLLDLGAFSNWYVSDITRTYPVSGKFTQRQKDLYNIVLEAQNVAMSEMRAGVSELAVNNAVKRYYAKELKNMKLIKLDSEVERYFYHGIGHSIGLDLHDLKNPEKLLLENAVFTVEPGLYIAEEGTGIRIEDDVVVTRSGVELLSGDIIKTVADIENYMG